MKKGIKLAFLTAFISGVSVFANGMFVTKTDPVAFAFFRNLTVAAMLTLPVAGTLGHIGKKDWLKLFSIGAVGGGIPFGLFFLGLAQIGGVQGNIINKSLFLWVAILAVPFLREKLHWFTLIGYGVLFFGLFWGVKLPYGSVGTYLVLSATVLWAIEHVIAKKTLPRVSPLTLAWARMVFGLPFLGMFVVLRNPPLSVPYQAVAVSALLLSAYMILWYTALKHAPATLVSSILVIAPVITLILQKQSVMHVPVLLIAGVFMILISQKLFSRNNV